jgi:anthranilate phosphoribosyltransferase
MIREAIAKLVERENLSEDEASACMHTIMTNEATPAQFGAFVVALRMKGESIDELAGMARAMRHHALAVELDGALLDTCGTGGDNSGTFNASTAAAFVAAGAGARVAKHGNRAMTSACGSADVLEALGVRIDLTPAEAARCIREAGIGFMFAQSFHPAMKFAAPLRREIGVRTVFNILGPLTNPARAQSQVLGAADRSLAEKLAHVLERLDTKHALVVHGEDGLDEVSVSATTEVYELKGGRVGSWTVHPSDLGLSTHDRTSVKGGAADENAAAIRRVLDGEGGALRDFTLMNASAALVAADLAPDMREGVRIATEAIDSGAARERLAAMVRVSNEVE